VDVKGSGVGGFEGSLPPTPLQRKFSPDFYVLHRPHWAAQGGSGPRPAAPLVKGVKFCLFERINTFGTSMRVAQRGGRMLDGSKVLFFLYLYTKSSPS